MVHRSDDDDTEDLYDDEFDFVDEDDDLEDEVDDAEEDAAAEDDAAEADDASDLDASPLEEDEPAKGRGRGRKPAPPRKAPVPSRSLFDEPADEPAAARAPRDNPREERFNGDAAEQRRDDNLDETFEDEKAGEEVVDDYSRPAPLANYRVHVYEYKEFKRTIDRPFTPEDAEAFASEYNRTSKSYGRFAVTGKDDVHPRKLLD
jgi:hypothetical protein